MAGVDIRAGQGKSHHCECEFRDHIALCVRDPDREFGHAGGKPFVCIGDEGRPYELSPVYPSSTPNDASY